MHSEETSSLHNVTMPLSAVLKGCNVNGPFHQKKDLQSLESGSSPGLEIIQLFSVYCPCTVQVECGCLGQQSKVYSSSCITIQNKLGSRKNVTLKPAVRDNLHRHYTQEGFFSAAFTSWPSPAPPRPPWLCAQSPRLPGTASASGASGSCRARRGWGCLSAGSAP